MIGISQNNLRAGLFNQIKRNTLDRRGSTDRHERRQIDHSARSRQPTQPCSAMAINMQQLELKTRVVH